MRNWHKVLLGSLGAILLGAVGSGVWDLALRRIVLASLSGLYSLGTLGVDSFRDRIYLEAARGFREMPSLLLLAVLAGTFLGIPSGALGFKLGRRVPRRADYATDDAFRQACDTYRHRWRRLAPLLGFVLIAFTSFVLLELARLVQTNGVVAHFQQCMTILAPQIDGRDTQILRARFAAMRTKRDYVALLRDVELQAQNHGIALPTLDWSY